MEKFLRVETIEAEPMTKSAFLKKVFNVEAYDEKTKTEEGFLIKTEEGYSGWISKKDFDSRRYMSYNKLPYPLAYYMLQEKKCDYIRLPQWKKDVKIKAQFPDQFSKMTAPYTFVESRFGNAPHKTTVIEEWDKNWEVHSDSDIIGSGFTICEDGSIYPKYIYLTPNETINR